MSELVVHSAGIGTKALVIHGSGGSGEAYLELAAIFPGYEIVAPDRPNYGHSPEAIPSSVETEVRLLGDQIVGGAHVIGQSYGGFLAMLLSARWPERVRSLTVHEPAAFHPAQNHPEVQAMLARLADVYPPRPDEEPAAWNRRWGLALEMEPDESPLSPEEERATVAMMREQPPWETHIDLDRIAAAPFPKLVMSGGWSAAFTAVCDIVAERLGARRIDFPGTGHGLMSKRDQWAPLVAEMWRSVDQQSQG